MKATAARPQPLSIEPCASSAALRRARADGPRLTLAHPPSTRRVIPRSGDRVNGGHHDFMCRKKPTHPRIERRSDMAVAPAVAAAAKKAPKQLPAANSDFYQLVEV